MPSCRLVLGSSFECGTGVEGRQRICTVFPGKAASTATTPSGAGRWDNGCMIEALLWGILGTIGIVGLVLGLAAAYQMGRAPYRSR